MSEKYPLQETLSPIDKKGRDRLNENWTRITAYFDHVQLQIKALAGGQEVDELIARLEQAIVNAETDLQNYIAQVDSTVQEAINANNTATQDAINANNTALQTALQTVSNKLTELATAISNAETATQDANAAKNAAIQATQVAQNAINSMQSLIDNFGPRGAWSSTTQYYKNNLAELDGRTYIALKDNINTPVTDKSTWALFADKGATGATGPQGKDGKDGTGVNIIGSLSSEADLPQTGSPGDAYMIGGDLYVWQANLNEWKNVGPIQGPEGKSAYDLAMQNGFEGTMEEWLKSLIGPAGPDGPPGPPADLTEINQKVDGIQNEVTEHLRQMATIEEAGHVILVNELTTGGVDKAASAETVKTLKSQLDTHGNDNNKHLVNGERTTWNNKLPTFATPWKEGLDPNTHTDTFYVSDHPNLGGGYWYVENRWYGDKSNGILMQVATSYTGLPDQKVRRKGQDGSWTEWSPSFQSLKQSVSDWKAAVNQAITDMGVYTAPDATFATTAANIRALPRAQSGTMYVPSLSAGQTTSVDVTASGFTPKNAYCMAGGIVMVDGSLGGTSLSAGTLVTQNIQVIGTTVRYTLYVGSGGSGWSGGNIKYVIS